MAYKTEQFREALDRVRDSWDEQRVSAVFSKLEKKRHNRRIQKMATISIVFAVIFGGALWFFSRDNSPSDRDFNPHLQAQSPAVHGVQPTTQESEQEPAREEDIQGTLHFDDGSRAIPSSSHSKVIPMTVSSEGIVVAINSGGARFQVTPQENRSFRVKVGDISVVVVGTTFFVEKAGQKARVEVIEGIVRVEWPDGSQRLSGGQKGLFPPDVPEISDEPQISKRPVRRRVQQRRDWRDLAEQGAFDEAFELMNSGGNVRDVVDDLLLAADVARLSGHPSQALPFLDRVVQDHRDDPRAPLASFTRGRILLNRLGRPQEAAWAFAQVRLLAPRGSLAEDALAREVESWHLAGESVRARQLAREYVERYPQGSRLRQVISYGGIELPPDSSAGSSSQ